jgi:hypothetical protein
VRDGYGRTLKKHRTLPTSAVTTGRRRKKNDRRRKNSSSKATGAQAAGVGLTKTFSREYWFSN